MKRFFVTLPVMLAAFAAAFAQDALPTGLPASDSTVLTLSLDSTCIGKNIFDLLPAPSAGKAGVCLKQDSGVRDSLLAKAASSTFRTLDGYRIRIYFSNEQDARIQSETAAVRFSGIWEDIPVYRIYENAYFKVTVGNFITKSEALAFLDAVRREFPNSFIVREKLYYTF